MEAPTKVTNKKIKSIEVGLLIVVFIIKDPREDNL
jgi:hypothetical protein